MGSYSSKEVDIFWNSLHLCRYLQDLRFTRDQIILISNSEKLQAWFIQTKSHITTLFLRRTNLFEWVLKHRISFQTSDLKKEVNTHFLMIIDITL